MNILFLVFHGFDACNGISKKITYQVEALRTLGHTVVFGAQPIDSHGHWVWTCNDQIVADFGKGLIGKLKKRWCYTALTDYILTSGFDLIYMRSNHNANPFTIRMVKRIRRAGIQIVMEIPTYPYDMEYKALGIKERLEFQIDKRFRHSLVRHIDAIVTFGVEETIFGCRTIRISNGIDFNRIPLRQPQPSSSDTLRLIAVADISLWHGFDRAIKGVATYYKTAENKEDITLTLIGPGSVTVLAELQRLVVEYHLEERVTFTGPLSGKALDAAFDRADLAIGSLARHRSGITYIKTLKNREYAVRGIPFIYSESDADFEAMPYILKAPADESPLDLPELIRFYRSQTFQPDVIRDSVKALSWDNQMRSVLNQLLILRRE